ncbi:hypothetical protein QNI16_20310 [Cytophagaceae bacterium YF14B1]|uniref:Uncharacterized protein n=1 Tax=Xanthocytophaga flava TaxID=3048013 RepID=A0AAE3QQ62_9BACT|nr:hypothetical protein [Xanthocytophaga flavus]MDJ1482856.1 hypothetical protein [Xanthocytophaga flavus]
MDKSHLWIEIATASLLALLPLLFPRGKDAKHQFTTQEINLMAPQMRRFTWISVIVVLVVLFLCVALAIDLLLNLQSLMPSQQFAHPFTFMDIYWFFPGMGLGFALSIYVVDWVLRRIIGSQYDLLSEMSSQQYGINAKAAMRGLAIFGAVAGSIGVFLGYDWYAGVRKPEQQIVINPFLSFSEHTYPLQDIASLTYVDYYAKENGNLFHLPYYQFRFRDGFQWDSREGFRHVAYGEDSLTVAYIIQQTHLSIDTTQLVE